MLLSVCIALPAQETSKWIHFGPDHKLQYLADERGNRIMDFSYAGYRAGGVRLPSPPPAKTLKPIAGDNTAQIQAALDAVAGQGGGVVLLAPGAYDLAGMLTISASKVVLRGSGSGD